jgi:hypothetical protein
MNHISQILQHTQSQKIRNSFNSSKLVSFCCEPLLEVELRFGLLKCMEKSSSTKHNTSTESRTGKCIKLGAKDRS